MKHYLVEASDIFNFFHSREEGGVRGVRRGGLAFYRKSQEGGGVYQERGVEAGRVSAGNSGGGGLNFFWGPK